MKKHQKSTTDKSKYDCFVTFDILFVNIAFDICNNVASAFDHCWICIYCICWPLLHLHSGPCHVLMNYVNFGREVKSLRCLGREFQTLDPNARRLFSPKVSVLALLTTKSFFSYRGVKLSFNKCAWSLDLRDYYMRLIHYSNADISILLHQIIPSVWYYPSDISHQPHVMVSSIISSCN